MNNINQLFLSKKNHLIIGTVALISLFFTRFLYNRQMVRYTQLRERIKVEKEKGATLQRIIILNEKIKKLHERSWDTTDFNFILERVFNIGRQAHLKIVDIAPSGKIEEEDYILVPLSLSCEGTYQDSVFFLKQLETYNMLLRINRLNMEIVGGSSERRRDKGLLLKMTLSLQAVFLK